MDLSPLIFVALAIGWTVYLVPKALKQHDEVARSRSVDRFSTTMRVLARREPVGDRVVVTPGRAASEPVVTTKTTRPSAAQIRARREAARRATRRRRRVLGVVLSLNVVVAALAAASVVGWSWQALPGGLLVAWLVACRVMVKSEQAALAPVRVPAPAPASDSSDSFQPAVPAEIAVARNDQGFDEVAPEAETSTIPAITDPTLWEPLPVTLPTYVTKPAAPRRTVRTIDLGEPGAWTSGRTEEASAMAREADAARVSRKDDAGQRRAVGS